jgi:hypothetical protein
MARFSYNSNTGSDPNSKWTNASNAWNGNLSNYAEYDILAGTGKDTAGHLLITSWDNVPGIDGTAISKVEIGVYGEIESLTNNKVYVKPRFSGTTDGSAYTSINYKLEW